MKPSEELALLVAQERAIVPPPGTAEQGWTALNAALAAGAPPLAVAVTPLKLASSWTLLQVGLVPFVVGAIVGTTAIGVTALAPRSPAPSAPVGAPSAVSTPASAARADVLAAPPALDLPARTEPASSAAARPGAAPAATSAAPHPATFDAELALIRRAKAALDAGESEAAQRWLAEHQRSFPRGVFASEREGLVILLACRSGDLAAGRAAAQRYLQSGSVLADHIERACGLSAPLTSDE